MAARWCTGRGGGERTRATAVRNRQLLPLLQRAAATTTTTTVALFLLLLLLLLLLVAVSVVAARVRLLARLLLLLVLNVVKVVIVQYAARKPYPLVLVAHCSRHGIIPGAGLRPPLVVHSRSLVVAAAVSNEEGRRA
uniref:Uncharacterized protein n=1 Tax=Anopheles merus TaxID=30066 RepID=A0A182V8P0_ANOME